MKKSETARLNMNLVVHGCDSLEDMVTALVYSIEFLKQGHFNSSAHVGRGLVSYHVLETDIGVKKNGN